MVIFHVIIQYVFGNVRKTAEWAFQSVIHRVAPLVKLHFVVVNGEKVALATFQINLLKKIINLKHNYYFHNLYTSSSLSWRRLKRLLRGPSSSPDNVSLTV